MGKAACHSGIASRWASLDVGCLLVPNWGPFRFFLATCFSHPMVIEQEYAASLTGRSNDLLSSRHVIVSQPSPHSKRSCRQVVRQHNAHHSMRLKKTTFPTDAIIFYLLPTEANIWSGDFWSSGSQLQMKSVFELHRHSNLLSKHTVYPWVKKLAEYAETQVRVVYQYWEKAGTILLMVGSTALVQTLCRMGCLRATFDITDIIQCTSGVDCCVRTPSIWFSNVQIRTQFTQF